LPKTVGNCLKTSTSHVIAEYCREQQAEQAQCEAHAINEAIALKLLHVTPQSPHKPYASEPMLKSVSTPSSENLAALEGILAQKTVDLLPA